MSIVLKLITIIIFAFGGISMIYALNPKEKLSVKAVYAVLGLVSMMCVAVLWGII